MGMIEKIHEMLASSFDGEAGMLKAQIDGVIEFTAETVNLDLTTTNGKIDTTNGHLADVKASLGAIGEGDDLLTIIRDLQTLMGAKGEGDNIVTILRAIETAAGNLSDIKTYIGTGDDDINTLIASLATLLTETNTRLGSAAVKDLNARLADANTAIAALQTALTAGYKFGACEVLDGTSAHDESAVINAGADTWITISSAQNINFAIGANPTATDDSMLLTAGSMLRVLVTAGHKVSVKNGKAYISTMS